MCINKDDNYKMLRIIKRKTFTLAEVLITLVIIGIIAVICVNLIYTNWQKQETVSELKKMYTTLLQAAQNYQAATGVYITDFDTQLSIFDFMKEYFEPYLSVAKKCDTFVDCYSEGRTPVLLDGKTHFSTNIRYGAILNNGSFLGVQTRPGGVMFHVDLNGEKGPNKSGRDIFNFYLVNTSTLGYDEGCSPVLNKLSSGIYPGGYGGCYEPHAMYTREELLGNEVHRACSKNAALGNSAGGDGSIGGNACAALIMIDGWQIKNDYPW